MRAHGSEARFAPVVLSTAAPEATMALSCYAESVSTKNSRKLAKSAS